MGAKPRASWAQSPKKELWRPCLVLPKGIAFSAKGSLRAQRGGWPAVGGASLATEHLSTGRDPGFFPDGVKYRVRSTQTLGVRAVSCSSHNWSLELMWAGLGGLWTPQGTESPRLAMPPCWGSQPAPCCGAGSTRLCAPVLDGAAEASAGAQVGCEGVRNGQN